MQQKKIEPGFTYYFNDPVMGKSFSTTYYATARTLTTSLQAFATFSWDIAKVLTITLPQIQNTNASSTATVLFWCNVDSTDYYVSSLDVPVGQSLNTSVIISYSHLTGVIPGGSNIKTMYLKASLSSNISGVNLINGNYAYTESGGGGPYS